MSTPAPPVSGDALEAPPHMSFPARLAGVFVSPRQTFADIARRPDFIAPLILLILAVIAVSEVMLWKIGIERIVRTQVEHSSRASSMTPEQMQQAVEQGARIGSIFAHAGFVFVLIGTLIVAGVCLAVTNAIFGGKVKFKTAFAITCYASMVTLVSSIIAILLIMFGDVEHFDPQNPGPTNLGFFLNPTDTPKPLMSLAASLDVFTLWFIILLGIGFSEATSRRVKPMPLTLTIFGLWAVWVLAKMGLATLG